MYQGAGGALREAAEQRVACVALDTLSFDLNQLVVVERAGRLRRDCVSQPGVAEANDGLQLVSKPPEMAALSLGQNRRDQWGRSGLRLVGCTAFSRLRGSATRSHTFRSVQCASGRSGCGGRSGAGGSGAPGRYSFLSHGANCIAPGIPELHRCARVRIGLFPRFGPRALEPPESRPDQGFTELDIFPGSGPAPERYLLAMDFLMV
jgi:hypothetical protein